jgi:outer membrane lipoprotein carrier protein
MTSHESDRRQDAKGVPTRRSIAVSAVAGALALAGVTLAAASARAQDAGAVLDRAIAAYGRVSSMRADFVQEVSDPMVGGDTPSRGEFLQLRPGRFAMRWSRPKGDLIVSDGEYLWVYLPSSTPNQVVRTRLSGRPGESGDVVAEFLERPRERFHVAYVRAEQAGGRDADVLALTPIERNSAYTRVLVWVDRQDALVRKVEIGEASGAVRRITFDRLRVNVRIPASTFTFRPPAGARVVDASS